MELLYQTKIVAVGPEVSELLEGGLLVLFQQGAPPELAEISVIHAPDPTSTGQPQAGEPTIADTLRIGTIEAKITAMGPRSWAKARDLGHITFSFAGTPSPDRPGEICVTAVPHDDLRKQLTPGTTLTIARTA